MSKFIQLTLVSMFTYVGCQAFALDDSEIHGYHFHTYFYQKNTMSTEEALRFRNDIQERIDNGLLKHCRLNRVNMEPVGPHPIGSFETCCNKTSISPALSFFMQNYGNLSILVHPLTRWEILDHTERRMFLGPEFNLDVSPLSSDLNDNIDLCLPLETHGEIHHSINNLLNK